MKPSLHVAVAASGGLDSTVLLHATARQAAALGLRVHALHVHHGLQPEADRWLARVRDQCRRWAAAGLPLQFDARRLTGAPAPGDSVEAWARRGRYAALVAMAREAGCGLVLLAHHRRDQAETVLLQALRGAGAPGLAAMPRLTEIDGVAFARPWLAQPRERLQAYARRHRLQWVEDPSNTDDRPARSRLRQRVWPALAGAFPDAEVTLATVAARAQETRAVLDEVAQADRVRVSEGACIQRSRWLELPPARRALLLRHWLPLTAGVGMPETLLQRLLSELPAATAASWPAPGGWLRLHRDRLGFEAEGAATEPGRPRAIDLSRPGDHPARPWPGVIRVGRGPGGLPAEWLAAAELRPRTGGERFQSHAAGVPRSLKKQYQAAGVPAWRREGPLVWSRDTLLWVPGLGLDARVPRQAGGKGLQLDWLP